MTEELKHCPFCGGKEVKLFKEGSIWIVECLQCSAKAVKNDTKRKNAVLP